MSMRRQARFANAIVRGNPTNKWTIPHEHSGRPVANDACDATTVNEAASNVAKFEAVSHQTNTLNEGVSLLFDVVRFLAALIVAVAHLTHKFFSYDALNLMPEAGMAVGVFFVLSGFFMRYITTQRNLTGR